MKPEKIREMSADELRSKERELQEQLFRLRFQKSIGQLDDAGKIRDTRRDIARVKTIIRQHDIDKNEVRRTFFRPFKPVFGAVCGYDLIAFAG